MFLLPVHHLSRCHPYLLPLPFDFVVHVPGDVMGLDAHHQDGVPQSMSLQLLSRSLHGDIRIDVPMFNGQFSPDAMIDWLKSMEAFFYYKRI